MISILLLIPISKHTSYNGHITATNIHYHSRQRLIGGGGGVKYEDVKFHFHSFCLFHIFLMKCQEWSMQLHCQLHFHIV